LSLVKQIVDGSKSSSLVVGGLVVFDGTGSL
jgi:hypothetical protein